MRRLRVIQWTTGKVGKLSLRAILDDPRLELVGVYAWSDDKKGADAGQLCGRPDCGIAATNDIDALLASGADTVIYTPFVPDVDDTIRLLESGLDVISTNLFLHVGGIQGEVRDRIEAACQRGNSSFYVTGINPGWINGIASALTAVCRRVDSVSISESANCTTYELPETWLAMGMSLPEASAEVVATARAWLSSFRDAVLRIAEALEFEPDDIEFWVEFATASKRVDLGWFVIEKDTNAAVRGGWNAKVNGRAVVRIDVAWYLTRELNEGWAFDDDHYHIVIEGEPGLDTRIRLVPPDSWGNHEWDTTTALPAVHSALDVRKARPGILSLKDVGLTCASARTWQGS